MINTAPYMIKMIEFYQGNTHDIAHFMKVHSFARTIGLSEGIDEKTLDILEIATIIHDIACPLCRIKYGNTEGKHQEEESDPLVKEFLKEFELDLGFIERVNYLVCHHHTYTNVDGMDYQILLEADFLVNADESHYSMKQIQSFKEKVFQTKTGINLLESIYE